MGVLELRSGRCNRLARRGLVNGTAICIFQFPVVAQVVDRAGNMKSDMGLAGIPVDET